MPEKIETKLITKKEDIDLLLNATEEDCLKLSFIMECFGEFDGKPRFNPYDTIVIPKGSYGPEGKKNKNDFTTTVGIWIFNKAFIEQDLFDIFHYYNQTITNKNYKKINKTLSYAVMEDKITVKQLSDFIQKTQKFQPYCNIYSPSYTLKMLLCTKEVDKKKAELEKKYKDKLANGDAKAAEDMEKELLAYITDYLADDPSMDMYNSGARGSFDNNFKNMYIMKGAIKDPDPTKGYNIVTSSLMDGVKKDEYAAMSNSLAAGPYSRARKTATGGHWELLFLHATQHVMLDPEGSDCGTTRYITITLSPDIIDDCMYNYIIEGSKLVELNSDNKDKYLNKTVKMRFSSMCESKTGICNKCAGNLFYKLNIKNVGEATPQLASKIKNLAMKSFHDSTVKFAEMDVFEAFNPKL